MPPSPTALVSLSFIMIHLTESSELGSTDNYTSLYIANEEELSILEEFPKHLCPSKVSDSVF